MSQELYRLQEAAEYAIGKEKAQTDHRLAVSLRVSEYGVLVVATLDGRFQPRVTESRKLATWQQIEFAHINVLIKVIDELVDEMLGELA